MFSFTVIILTHGREKLLSKCLDSLRPGDVSWQLILVANGKPLSEEILEKAKNLTPHCELVYHAQTLSPGKARNLALELASGEWIFFLDDDAYVLPGYWEIAETHLHEATLDVFGGPDVPAKGMNKNAQALAIALASPLCTGKTSVRHRSFGHRPIEAGEDKLTSCNLWVRKSSIDNVRFPQDYIRGEESAFLLKLQLQGKRIIYDPRLLVAHHRRAKVREIFRPTFWAGFYRSELMRSTPSPGDALFWLPALFVILHSLFFLQQDIFWYLARMYLSLTLFISVAHSMRDRRPGLFLRVVLFHYLIIFNYGLGFLMNRIARRPIR